MSIQPETETQPGGSPTRLVLHSRRRHRIAVQHDVEAMQHIRGIVAQHTGISRPLRHDLVALINELISIKAQNTELSGGDKHS
jgi:hypothetical protein